jgi:hypothetical protein
MQPIRCVYRFYSKLEGRIRGCVNTTHCVYFVFQVFSGSISSNYCGLATYGDSGPSTFGVMSPTLQFVATYSRVTPQI